MLVQNKIEDAAANVISSSLANNNITTWQIYKGMGNSTITFPCIKVICHDAESMYKELNIGTYKAHLEVLTCGIKAVGDAGQGTTASQFETISDLAFNPFLSNAIAPTLASYTSNLQVFLVSDEGLEVTTLTDGWIATQKFEVVCARTS